MGKAYLLTGEPRIGKTTALLKIIKKIGRHHCGGFCTEEVRVNGERRGFKMVDLHDYARIIADVAFDSELRIGKYGVNLEAMEDVGSTALSHAWQYDEIIVIDEIGPMQLLSARIKTWVDAVFQETQRPKPIIGTIVLESDDPFIVELKQRDGVKLFPMTVDNRDTIHEVFLDALRGETDGCLL